MQSGTLLTIFQSTLPRRERLLLRNNVHSDCIFQSTLPRRERRCIDRSTLHIKYFNPHSHEGSDRFCRNFFPCCTLNFNPHSHEGSDFCKMVLSWSINYFNPHSHEGSDTINNCSVCCCVHFNPHSHEGSDSNINQ